MKRETWACVLLSACALAIYAATANLSLGAGDSAEFSQEILLSFLYAQSYRLARLAAAAHPDPDAALEFGLREKQIDPKDRFPKYVAR